MSRNLLHFANEASRTRRHFANESSRIRCRFASGASHSPLHYGNETNRIRSCCGRRAADPSRMGDSARRPRRWRCCRCLCCRVPWMTAGRSSSVGRRDRRHCGAGQRLGSRSGRRRRPGTPVSRGRSRAGRGAVLVGGASPASARVCSEAWPCAREGAACRPGRGPLNCAGSVRWSCRCRLSGRSARHRGWRSTAGPAGRQLTGGRPSVPLGPPPARTDRRRPPAAAHWYRQFQRSDIGIYAMVFNSDVISSFRKY